MTDNTSGERGGNADEAENATEYMRERAAIMEIDGGLVRADAEYFAVVATRDFCGRTGRTEPRTPYYQMVSRGFSGEEAREPGERGHSLE